MAPGTKRKSEYKTDDFVASDNDDRPAKRGKGGKSTFEPSGKAEVDDNGDTYWQLTKNRRITVSEFKKNVFVNIREYYDDNGTMKPGKKGISLPVDQYSTLLSLLPRIEASLTEKGHKVPRPDFDASAATANDQDDEDEDDADEPRKSNIEATSDEDED